ncbi:hypothetical protein [Lentibacillus amyloliquefaciens]|uniref:hypothetical protein n=1 Tax=Lentibacillus amyloliquefaciens TaxID=1472767 RepID=UPI0012E3F54F|nr:hypothetical protein [Lentibacillus amyloliquefaciens]
MKKFEVINNIIPIAIKGIDNAANESGVPETPAIVSLNANPKAEIHIPVNAITFPVRLNLFKNIYTPILPIKNYSKIVLQW